MFFTCFQNRNSNTNMFNYICFSGIILCEFVEPIPYHTIPSPFRMEHTAQIYCVRFKKYIVEQARNSGQAECVLSALGEKTNNAAKEREQRGLCPSVALKRSWEIFVAHWMRHEQCTFWPQLFHTKPKILLLSIQAIDYIPSLYTTTTNYYTYMCDEQTRKYSRLKLYKQIFGTSNNFSFSSWFARILFAFKAKLWHSF